jgi:hypothetical protein
MKSSEVDPALSVWREVVRVYGFAGVMFALAIIPVLNFTYSGHGGISWFFVPFCFPYVLFRGILDISKASEASRRWYVRFFAVSIPVYIILAIPLSWASTTSIRSTFGLQISTGSFLGTMVCPVPWWYLQGIWTWITKAQP